MAEGNPTTTLERRWLLPGNWERNRPDEGRGASLTEFQRLMVVRSRGARLLVVRHASARPMVALHMCTHGSVVARRFWSCTTRVRG